MIEQADLWSIRSAAQRSSAEWIIAAVAAELGGTVEPHHGWDTCILVDGVLLWCEVGTRLGHRLYVQIDCPYHRNWRGEETRYQPRPGAQMRISLSADRDPALLARDIRRRILPYAIEVYPQWVAAAEQANAEWEQSERFRDLLVSMRGRRVGRPGDVVGEGPRYRTDRPTWGAGSFVRDRCTLSVSGVSPALAEQIIMLVDEWREPS